MLGYGLSRRARGAHAGGHAHRTGEPCIRAGPGTPAAGTRGTSTSRNVELNTARSDTGHEIGTRLGMEPRPPGRGGVRRRRRLGPGACLLLALSFGGASPSTPAGARGGTPSPPRVAAAGPSCPDHAGSLLPELGDDLVRLVLVRHGMSIWNKDNRFTAWMDVPLSRQGLDDAHRAGMLCRQAGIRFDVAFTSVLQRAIKTCHMILEEIRQLWIPTVCDWRLNERHDGALTGLNKKMAVVMYGDKNVSEWRRSYGVSPPPLNREHPCVPPPRPPPAHARARVARALVPWSTCA